MIAKLNSPLGSPTLAAQLRNRLPTQMRRCIPLYIACIVLVLLVNVTLFASDKQHRVSLRPPFASRTEAPKVGLSFPRKIWQTWKVNPFAFEQRDLDRARSWTERNPDYQYEVLTDSNEMAYVDYHYGPAGFNRPDIVQFYHDLQAAIVKADLLRYLVMYAEGGLYADIDVEALKPMFKFIPERYNPNDFDMVVGVEIDEPDWKDHPILGPKSRSFCQWTFMCKPHLPVMMRLIEQIMSWLKGVAKKQGVPLSEVVLDFDEIIGGTGPSAFTNAMLAEMTAANPNGRRPITWDTFHDMGESKIVSRVLVLTVEAFAAGQGHSDSGTHEARAALVRHHYHASNWPSRHPRYSHPVYGQVEDCNWNDDCVHKWDDNVAAFKKMSPDDQKRLIAEKEKERKEEKEREEREKREREERERREREDRERREREEAAVREAEEKAKKAAEEKKGKGKGSR